MIECCDPVTVNPPRKALVLLSGGLDSSTCLTMAVNEFGADNVIAVTMFYGQKHEIEIAAAEQVCKLCKVGKHKIIQLPDIFKGYGSTLMDDDKPNPELSYEDINDSYGVSPTYVPFRNGNLLSVATALALQEGASVIFYGAHAEDALNWAYPDCTAEFNGAMANAIYVGSYHQVRLVTPLQWCTKADVVRIANEIDAPLASTYSCYNGREKHCGTCPTCVGRIKAFKANGMIDPVCYEIDVKWED